ncbi:lethal(2)neighbour of Tid protein [Galendromus occidentalis]|uniref:dolichyl-P-Man:Man5GlcNAc2-PP-dolichol alpha-1,3-mannosyltransferase n=1 Tax=Galendromus occidentalis TaxID=34638 RepID=A0AAJ6QMT5_9ACAR|nr:lethal(2)neighbour of Tid protein [Galendromus occidentalis]
MGGLRLKKRLRVVVSHLKDLLFDPEKLSIVGYVLLFIELVLNIFIIHRVNYTEIDWRAYMQEVEGVLNGTTDYVQLKGDTGPLVYPAGFVYIFSALYFFTNSGRDVRMAQYVFAIFYLIMLHLVFHLYAKTRKTPPYVLILMSASSYRIHSIFVLRLFNDAVAMLILYVALGLFIKKRWSMGCLMYSFAVSVKMNILLFAPALFFVLLNTGGYLHTFKNLTVCALVQLIPALPFLIGNYESYILRAFDLGRVFEYEWTVNYRCIPEWLFLSKSFHLVLLALHVGVLLAFIPRFMRYCAINRVQTDNGGSIYLLLPDQILFPMFVSNFIGIVFARSLHYQFYVWYYHSIPYILWSLPITTLAKLLLWGLIEMSWNTYPSTVYSSCTLHACHLSILCVLWFCWPQKSRYVIKKKTA